MHDLPKSLMEPWKLSLTAAVKTHRLALDNVRKLGEQQLDMMRASMDLGFARLRAAAEIRDAQDLLAFQSGQIEAAMSLSEKLIADGKALADLGDGILAECGRLTEDVIGQPALPLPAQSPRKAA
ncbi:phasin family protein [Bosea sp. BIWAKO-01]|uniref:phasin family protein n=1 Tax=Bosea sp. BIWAKO-01 TaxID=506668 RepID=UPI000853AC00|nr:phasin family protein [Bosea sp. BIWAKO-01]GAU85913.1 hypothetical protein BIWAKO_05861 [Bosea sp. BIWAKO-01]